MLIAKMPNGDPEIYTAVQGEGPSSNKLVVFVRLSSCNLQCNFCDTAYTWFFQPSPKAKGLPIMHKYAKPVWRSEYMMEMGPKQVADEIIKLAGPHFKRVVFTGGEPMLQQKEIMEAVNYLKADYHHWDVEVETNGTVKVMPDCKFMDQINCSPKLASSGNKKEARDNPVVIAQFLKLWRDAKLHHLSFKFVIQPEHLEDDLAEVEEWEKTHGIPRSLIYLMPEGITEDRIKHGTTVLMDICRERGYQFCTRLHVLLYGDKRAV